jgi:hypothetical protein
MSQNNIKKMLRFAPVSNVGTVRHIWALMADILNVSNMNGPTTFLHYKLYLILQNSATNVP